MKKIIREYSIVFSEKYSSLSVARFPTLAAPALIKDVKYKPKSKYLEITKNFPGSNSSMIRKKKIGYENLSYKGLPVNIKNHYVGRVEENEIVLLKLESIYVLELDHWCYPIEIEKTVITKAENREELEHRKKSLVYKRKIIENEDSILFSMNKEALHENKWKEKKSNSVKEILNNLETLKIKRQTESSYKIEKTIKRAKVVNRDYLISLYGNRNLVDSFIISMTKPVCSRYILKSDYYEKGLRILRNKMLEEFKSVDTRPIDSFGYLGDDIWMIEEIAQKIGRDYILKGYPEENTIDIEEISREQTKNIERVLLEVKMGTLKMLNLRLGLDIETIRAILSNTDRYHHLANNMYSINSPDYWFNPVLSEFARRKSLDLDSIKSILAENVDNNQIYSAEEIAFELRSYCLKRGARYYLKSE